MRKRRVRHAGTRVNSRHVESLENRLLLAAQPLNLVHAPQRHVFSPHIVRTARATHTVKAASNLTTARVQAAALVNVSVSGSALWTDANGGTHGIPLATVEIRSTTELDTDPPLATLQTDLLGKFGGAFSFDPSGGAITVFARIFARNPSADVKPDAGAGAKTYFMDTAVKTATGAGVIAFPAQVAGNSVAAEESFGILGATLETANYAANLSGRMPSQLDVRFPSNESANGTASFFDAGTRQLFITAKRVFDWDVIQHEYGHYVQDTHGFAANAEGPHTFFVSNPKPDGPGLAWNEGFATWFAISAQLSSGNPPYAAGVPEVGDTSFDPTGGPTANLATQTGMGELDEYSVAASLYHLSTGDEGVQISDKMLFQDFMSDQPKTFGAAWDAIAKDVGGNERSQIGYVLGLQNIAPVETAPASSSPTTSGAIPTFTWKANGSNDFVLQFYSSDFSTLIDQTADLGNVNTFTPSSAEWARIFDGNSTVKWVVEGLNTTTPITPGAGPDETYGGTLERYWSNAGTLNAPQISLIIDNTASMQPEIASVQQALRQYITNLQSSLAPGDAPPVIELITFIDSPEEVISSSNLTAVTAAINAMTATGGGDIPEPSAQAVEFAAQQIGNGGTILLITDAPSDAGSDLNSTIAMLRAKGVTFNAEISGDLADQIEPTDAVTANTLSTKILRGPPSAGDSSTTASPAMAPNAGDSSEPGGGSHHDPDPAQGPISDPGQTPLDDVGNSAPSATRLTVDGPVARGAVGNTVQDSTGGNTVDGSDYFVFHLLAGAAYNIPLLIENSGVINAQLLDLDSATVLQAVATVAGDTHVGAASLSFTPTVTGDYFLKLTAVAGAPPYTVQVSDNPLIGATSSIALFSTAAAQTGGEFLFKDAIVTSTDPAVITDYQSSILNVMDSTFEPTVLSASPNFLPLGQTITITLTGRNTNWSPGLTTVGFSAPGFKLNSVTVTSATSLVASVTVGSTATVCFSDVLVKATLGTRSEVATGTNAVQLTAAPTTATLLQVQPASLVQGQIQTVTLNGTGTAWKSTSTVSLGPGITVMSINVISPTRVTANIQISPAARIGFRAATVVTGAASDTEDRALLIGSAALTTVPVVTTVSPNSGVIGTHADVNVTASNAHFLAGMTTASFGPDVVVDSVDVIDATHAIVHLDVPANASIGYQNVSMTTGTETAALLNGFYVAPLITMPVVTAPATQTLFSGVNQSFNLGSFSAGGPGPWTVDVNWGDQSPDTIFSASSTGAIAPQNHVYALHGNQTITVTVANAVVSQYLGAAISTASVIANNALLLTSARGTGLSVGGLGVLNATGSGTVFVNSLSKTAAEVMGKHASASAFEFDIAGAIAKGSHFHGIARTAQPAVSNPLALMTAPSAPLQVFKAVHDSSATPVTLQPGAYLGGIHLSGRASVALAPGLYYIQRGGFSVTGHATVVGDGVTIYLTGRPSPITISGNVQLTPPTSGAFKGIVFFQNSTSGGNISITGNLTIAGIFYAPSATLSVSGRGQFTDNADPADIIDALSIFSSVRISARGNMTIDSASNIIEGSLGA